MSIQQVNPYPQRTGAQTQEDCRDYLRTGRCKYGASCKYNHPSNVQTGGGLKGPIDPTEPMFPVRPNEPVCQYYMKHGTCKFGQACKFHHPPQSALTATLVSGGAVLMNVGRAGDTGHQVLLNAVATDTGGSSMMLQFLPQRPDEPDCIYFLRNGRCKYGATCRYHHPVNYVRKSRDDGGVRRSPLKGPQVVDNSASPQFQFVMSSPSYPPSPFHQSQNNGGSHVVLTDGPLTFVSLDGSSSMAEHSFRSLAMQQNTELAATHGAHTGAPGFGLGMPQEQNSSSSSISSSYETAGSSMGDSGSALWNARRSGSGSSLNAYVLDGHNHVPAAGGNDLSLSRRNRASSPGSDASGVYFDSAASMSWSTGPAVASAGVYGPGPNWRSRRSSSFDQTRQVPQNHYSRSDMMPRSTSVPEALAEHGHMGQSPLPSRRLSAHATRQHRGFHGTSDNTDEGLSMMTSALLNMIDTPEDSTNGFGVYEDDVTEDSLPEPTTPRSGSSFRAYSNYAKHASAPQLPRDENSRASNLPTGSYSPGFNGSNDNLRYSGASFSVRQNLPNLPYREQASHVGKVDDFSWSPSWQGSLAVGRQMEEKAQSLSAIQPSVGPNPTPGATNVGLFLP
jgi:translation initiation factor 4G